MRQPGTARDSQPCCALLFALALLMPGAAWAALPAPAPAAEPTAAKTVPTRVAWKVVLPRSRLLLSPRLARRHSPRTHLSPRRLISSSRGSDMKRTSRPRSCATTQLLRGGSPWIWRAVSRRRRKWTSSLPADQRASARRWSTGCWRGRNMRSTCGTSSMSCSWVAAAPAPVHAVGGETGDSRTIAAGNMMGEVGIRDLRSVEQVGRIRTDAFTSWASSRITTTWAGSLRSTSCRTVRRSCSPAWGRWKPRWRATAGNSGSGMPGGA
jgi:hypothetical protein